MLQALLAGVASIRAQQTRMNVIGNNIANVNTTAFKGSRVTFQTMLSQTVKGARRPTANLGGTNPVQFGLGVVVAGTATQQDQGSLQATNRLTDLAIQGEGFFAISNGERIAYTRDGAFDFDATGSLVHRGTGERLLGWTADSTGTIDTTTPINSSSFVVIPLGQVSAVRETTLVEYVGNLSVDAESGDSWTTSVRAYDSLGAAHTLDLVFTNHQAPPLGTAPTGAVSSFDWAVYENGTLLSDYSTTGNSRLYFDSDGELITDPAGGVPALQTMTLVPDNGASTMTVSLDFRGISSLASATQVQATNQNGFPPGSLSGFNIDSAGLITGIFTNGLTRALGQLALALFPNPSGLEHIGSNLYRDTDNSGLPVIGTPSTNGRGTLHSGFLEQSNVDIGSEFTDLIVTQRGFQANTRVVTTVDEMLQELLNMKR
jgi:flagellar hook protein FlgE